MKIAIYLLALCASWNIVNSAKILVVFPAYVRSHYVLGNEYVRGLLNKGHNVTFITTFDDNLARSRNLDAIVLSDLKEHLEHYDLDSFNLASIHKWSLHLTLALLGDHMVDKIFQHPKVTALLHSDETFDAVVCLHFLNDALKYFAYHFDAPLVTFSTGGANDWINPLVGNPDPPSSVAESLSGFPNRMSFLQRVINTIMYVNQHLFWFFFYSPLQNSVVHQNFPEAPHLDYIRYNSSIVLLNSHPSINEAVPMVPGMIEIGGFHLTDTKPEFDKSLSAIIKGSKNGIIFVNLGSLFKNKDLTATNKKDVLMSVLGNRKETIIWNWEEGYHSDKPENIKVVNHVSQHKLLGVPTVKLFITEGSQTSIIDAVYHKVPILVIPINKDFDYNADFTLNHGGGIYLPFKYLDNNTLSESISELIENPGYKKNITKRSAILRDRPQHPMETAIYWTEYVIRHPGAPDLKVAGQDLQWFQYLLIDVFVFIGIVTIVGLVILFYLFLTFFISSMSRSRETTKVKFN